MYVCIDNFRHSWFGSYIIVYTNSDLSVKFGGLCEISK